MNNDVVHSDSLHAIFRMSLRAMEVTLCSFLTNKPKLPFDNDCKEMFKDLEDLDSVLATLDSCDKECDEYDFSGHLSDDDCLVILVMSDIKV